MGKWRGVDVQSGVMFERTCSDFGLPVSGLLRDVCSRSRKRNVELRLGGFGSRNPY